MLGEEDGTATGSSSNVEGSSVHNNNDVMMALK